MRVRIVLLGVVLGRVVRGEERPAVEEQAAGPLAAADDGDGVGRVPQLGPDLRQVLGPPLDVLPRGRRTTASAAPTWNRRQRSWALRSQVCSMTSRAVSNSSRCDSGIAVEVEEGHRVVAGVVVAADERRSRPGSTSPRRPGRSRTRGSLRIWAMARAFGPPAAPPQAPQL